MSSPNQSAGESTESHPVILVMANRLRHRLIRRTALKDLVEVVENRDPCVSNYLAILFLILAISFSAAPLINSATSRMNKDYDLWQRTGWIVSNGQSIYPTDPNRLFPFMYPPPAAVMLAPIAELPRPLFVASLLILQTAAWAFCIYASVRLSTGRFRGVHPALYVGPSLMVIPFVSDMYLLGQPAVLLLALCLGSFLALRRSMPALSGFLLATATAIKAYPIILIGYFVYRKKTRASMATIAGVIFYLAIFPLTYRTTEQVGQDLSLWARGMLFKYDDRSIGQRPDRAFSYKNQSLQATVHRLSRPVLADGENDRSWYVNLTNLDFRRSNYLMMASIVAIGCFTMWAWWGSGWPGRSRDDAINSEQSMSLMLTVMLAPLSFNYSYVWLIFPLTFLMAVALDDRRTPRSRASALWTVLVTVALLACSLLNTRVAAAYGNIFFAGFAAFVGIGIWERRGTFVGKDSDPGSLEHNVHSTSTARPMGSKSMGSGARPSQPSL
jgi:hypothetical protein